MVIRTASVLILVALASACGGSTPPPERASAPPPADEPAPPTYASPVTSGAIARADLDPVLDGGPGRFLQGVELEPHMDGNDFVGHRIVRLYPDDPRFASLALQPGDTVTRINGQRIERPEHFAEVWSSLRVASQLLVEYLHDGEPHELRFDIVD
ncbi:MAG: hypothetical protein CMN30_32915 [Sandaracinus sp.]|nr:hypothetical protein [Sandaracinus sp.]